VYLTYLNHKYLNICRCQRFLPCEGCFGNLFQTLPSPAGPAQHAESLKAIRVVATALAERAGRGDHTGEVCHWVDGYHLNVRVYEKLLMSVFDILDESHLVEVLVLSCSIFFLFLNLLFLNLQEWQSIV
jgi:hypothetical protein